MKKTLITTPERKAGMAGQVRFIKTRACSCAHAGTEACQHKPGSRRRPVISVGPWEQNLIMSGTSYGANLILKNMRGLDTYTLEITHADIGTSQTAPAASDTGLGTGVLRAAISDSREDSTLIGAFQFFYPDGSLADGTYYEFGMFTNGTSTLGTGRIFNHILLGAGYEKSAGEDTTVECQIAITLS